MSRTPASVPASNAASNAPGALFPARLAARAARAGAGPLVTYYDRPAAVRTELSGTSFGNWVDKTANLLIDELEVAPGERVALPLLDRHPGHWVSLVWVAACWRARAVVTPTSHPASGPPAVLEVVGPEDAAQPPISGLLRVACSLHPLGLGFHAPLPAGVLDYSTEARSQPDVFLGGPVAPDDPAWAEPDRTVDQAGLLAPAEVAGPVTAPDADADSGGREPGRTLVVPDRPWPTVRAALLRPVLTGGSVVVVVGADRGDLASLAAAERVTGPGSA